MEGRSFPRAFERRENFLYLGKLYEEFERYIKRAFETGSSLPRGPFGEPGGGSFTGTFEKKRECISGFLFIDPDDIKSCPGALFYFSKEQGAPELVSDYGVQRTR